MSIREELDNIFGSYGYDINDKEDTNNIDSMTNISIIIDIENQFNIEIPDELLNQYLLTDIDKLVLIITELSS